MKKMIHIVISYLGGFLFFSGLIATIIKWTAILLFGDQPSEFYLISLIVSFIIGFFITKRIYRPLEY